MTGTASCRDWSLAWCVCVFVCWVGRDESALLVLHGHAHKRMHARMKALALSAGRA